MNEVSVRTLQHDDLDMLHEWMNEPHLRPFYMQDDISLGEVNSKFAPRVHGEEDVVCLIAEVNSNPYGYAQWYFNRSMPDYGVGTKEYLNGISLDYFIGDPKSLGKGLGCEMLKAVVAKVIGEVQKLDCQFFLIHDNKNHSAINCSKNAGFELIDTMIYNNSESGIYRRTL